MRPRMKTGNEKEQNEISPQSSGGQSLQLILQLYTVHAYRYGWKGEDTYQVTLE